jgi:para-aminobenzoate synthetase component 1
VSQGRDALAWVPPGRAFLAGRKEHAGVDDAAFLDAAKAACAQGTAVTLVSGGQTECAQYSILAWDPLLILRSKGMLCLLERGRSSQAWLGDPLEAMDILLEATKPSGAGQARELPFTGGLAGYAAYELKNQIERLPQTALDDLGLPEMFWLLPRRVLVHQRCTCRAVELCLAWEGEAPAPAGTAPVAAFTPPVGRGLRVGPLSSGFSHDVYLRALARVRAYIRTGDVYQVNLSQRFSFTLKGDPFSLWERLLAVNPAPFYAYVNAGDHQVLSTSMERFLFRRGRYLETRPIKGTRPRGRTPAEDEALKRELTLSPKDDAELSMIVDLLRNDLGRVCRAGSVAVAEHKRVESYQNVHHLISIISGELEPGVGPGRLLRAAFPGGSVTGCPRIRAMEIIDELEPNVRHVYTGAMGYLGWEDNLDLNVAIRTAIHKDGRCCFSAGGGVVHDSLEEDEYQETLHKARTLLDLLKGLEGLD